MKKIDVKNLLGFTLAEVLITLGIIGIIAALTIPSLINMYQDQAVVSQLKKDYKILLQAFNEIKSSEGDLQSWCPFSTYSTEIAASTCAGDLFAAHLKVMKNCGTGTDAECIPALGYKFLKESASYDAAYSASNYYKIQLIDGSTIIFDALPDVNYDGIYRLWVFIDTNGPKPPNKWGYDFYEFKVNSTNFSPNNVGPSYPRVLVPDYTNRNGALSAQGCNNTGLTSGDGCASWVIYNENLDYKYVNDLNWTTKTHK